MARTTSRFGTATRGLLISLWVAAAAVASWQAPQASAQLAGPAPVAELFPRVVDFGDVPTGTASAPQTITFRNTGTAPLSISGIASVGGNFILVHDCPLGADSLAAGRFCTISVRFAPASGGTQAGVVQVSDSASSVAQEILLQGTGVAAAPKVAPSDKIVGFPDTIIYTTSGPLSVVFTNNTTDYVYPQYLSYYTQGSELSDFSGYPPLIYGSLLRGTAASQALGAKATTVPIAGPTGALHNCNEYPYPYYYNDGILGPGESCIAYIYFTPQQLGFRVGELDFSYYDSSENYVTATVLLVGTGVPADFWGISLSTDTLDFGGVVVGTSATRTLTVTSTGTGPLSVFGVRTFGDIFAATTDCTLSVPPGTACNVTVTCSPTALGQTQGDLYVDHNAAGGFTYVKLLCTGANQPVPKIEVASTGVGFGNQSLGSTSETQQVIIRSVGTAPLAIAGVDTASPFGVRSDCPVALDPGLQCVASVTFTPVASGKQKGSLSITSNDPDHPTVPVDLSGTGCRPFSVQASRRAQGLCGP